MDELISRLRGRIGRSFLFAAPFPASTEAVERTECQLGFPLPTLLRRIYLEVANGGFGPGYGIMGVAGGFTDDLDHNVGDLYVAYREGDPEDQGWIWPERLLPICHWGCAIYSVADCANDQLPMYFVDPGGKEPSSPMESVIKAHKPSLESWLSDWLDGRDLWKQGFGR